MVHFLYGYDLEVLIIPEITQTDENLRSFTPEERGCYFEGERKLKYFKVYSRRNCELETLSEFLKEHDVFNCTSFYLLRDDLREVCDHRYENDYRREIGNALKARDQILKNSGCLDECNMIKYRTEIIAHNVQVDRKAYNNTYWIPFDFETEIEFKFKDVDIVPLRRYRQMTFSDFLAQSGGMLGIFAGISVLSVIELFYFMTLRWMANLWRWIKNRY
jgi:amiloride-sensitive sodium channel